MSPFKAIRQISFNTILGALLLIIWLHFVDLKLLVSYLKQVQSWWLVGFLASFILSTIFRSWRLKLLIQNQLTLPFKAAMELSFLAQLLSFLIPLRAGEIAKGVYLSSQYNRPFSKTLVWAFSDRFLDFLCNLLLGLVLIPVLVRQSLLSAILGGAALISLLLIIFAIIKLRRWILILIRVVSIIFIFSPVKAWIIKTAIQVLEGVEVLNQPFKAILGLSVLTFASLISDAFGWIAIFYALNFNLDWLRGLLGSLLTTLTFLIPAAPGFVGTAQAATLLVFSGFLGLNKDLVSAVSVLYYLVAALCLFVFGLLSIYLLKFHFSPVIKKIFKR